jgi:hypothetical protein
MDERNSEKPGFWTTLPGILTGIAAVLTAAGGLIAGLTSFKGCEGKGSTSAYVATSPSPIEGKTASSTPTVQSRSVAITTLNGNTTYLSLESFQIYGGGTYFQLNDGHQIDFYKIRALDFLETYGVNVKVRLTLTDGTIVNGAMTDGFFEGNDKLGHFEIQMHQVKRVEFNR